MSIHIPHFAPPMPDILYLIYIGLIDITPIYEDYMAKSRSSNNKGRRDIKNPNSITSSAAHPSSQFNSQLDLLDYVNSLSSIPLTAYEDRRTYNPEPRQSRPARALSGFTSLVIPPNPIKKLRAPSLPSLPSTVAFSSPKNVLICVRRKMRKEVLHALKMTGKSGQRSPRRNSHSSIKC